MEAESSMHALSILEEAQKPQKHEHKANRVEEHPGVRSKPSGTFSRPC